MRRSDLARYLGGVEYFLRCLLEHAAEHGVEDSLQKSLEHLLDARRVLEEREFLRQNQPR